jgi:Flp pilus assembly protein TadD
MTLLEENISTPVRWQKLLPWILIGVGFLIYLQSIQGPFVYDDEMHITQNPTIRHLDQIGRILASDRRMVVTLSLAINYALDGDQPRLYHLFNVAVHLFAAALLYGIVRRTLLTAKLRDQYASYEHWLAFAVALLWMCHPLGTQAVAYVIQRGESLMGMFYLLTIYCLIRGSENKYAAGWYIACVIAMLLGLMSKEVMVTAPFVVLLYDRTFLAGSFKQALQNRWALYLGLVATWGYLAATKIDTIIAPAPTSSAVSVGFSTPGVTPWTYLATQSAVICHYLRLIVWPDALVFHYDWPMAMHVTEHWPQSLFVLALLFTTCWAIWRYPPWGFLGAWFLIILSPTSSFIPIKHAIFEYRMYLPLAGVVALVVFAIDRLLSKQPKAALSLLLVVAVALGARTVIRLQDYSSSMQLWQSVVIAQPKNTTGLMHLAIAHKDRADLLRGQGKGNLAMADYNSAMQYNRETLAIDPTEFEAAHNIGVIFMEIGQIDLAQAWFLKLLKQKPDDHTVLYNLGRIAFGRGDLALAERRFLEAIKQKRDHVSSHDMRGVVLAKQGKFAEAAREHETAIEINPGNTVSYNNLGRVRLEQHQPENALTLFIHADELSPGNSVIIASIGDALAQLDRSAEAVRAYKYAMKISPNSLSLALRLAWLYSTHPNASIRDGNEAVAMMQQAKEITRGQIPNVLDALAAAYAEVDRFDDAVQTQQQALAILDPTRKDDQQIKPAYEKRLALYQSGKPYRQKIKGQDAVGKD